MTVIDLPCDLNSRTVMYGAQPLNPFRSIAIAGNPKYLNTFPGQCAAIVLGNILSRMSPNVAITFPNTRIDPRLRWLGDDLQGAILKQMRSARPHARFEARPPKSSDYAISLGDENGTIVTSSTAWLAYAGPGPVPFLATSDENPFGAIFSVILAAAQLFIGPFPRSPKRQSVNTFSWNHTMAGCDRPLENTPIGAITTAGVGSVGSAALYFLALSGSEFSAQLIDFDLVKTHNLDRSPIFTANDAESNSLKIASVKRFLTQAGINNIQTDDKPFHESDLWTKRSVGEPDVLIAAANELNVRRFTEYAFPPIQIYATTGRNWQTSLIRHIPFKEACSYCLFPSKIVPKATSCASAPSEPANSNKQHGPDAALPFLSFAAGLMTATELVKLNMLNYPLPRQRITISFRPDIHISHTDIPEREGCVCGVRSVTVHTEAIKTSRYFRLSTAEQADLKKRHSAA